jgi:hypothetical protein
MLFVYVYTFVARSIYYSPNPGLSDERAATNNLGHGAALLAI